MGFTCALTTGGGVKCRGYNGYWQLRFGIVERSNVPVDRLEYPCNVTGVSIGTADICIITSSHPLVCWGGNWYGELGNGTQSAITMPFNVPL
jgi:alpha-tubulin suppressor-like RCC1 family protein